MSTLPRKGAKPRSVTWRQPITSSLVRNGEDLSANKPLSVINEQPLKQSTFMLSLQYDKAWTNSSSVMIRFSSEIYDNLQ